jgi:hypothetical protein
MLTGMLALCVKNIRTLGTMDAERREIGDAEIFVRGATVVEAVHADEGLLGRWRLRDPAAPQRDQRGHQRGSEEDAHQPERFDSAQNSEQYP